ncbi:molybdopterin molybdenumtransferase MoeA [Aeromicrobium sp. 636]|uniref:Molybdopterin molybdenumtransferase n=1 Tax=Aeromicrobium senzhongii TaxID=2663859 RepID=A0A8I0K1D6_9ACTN|nr:MULTISPECIES: gephyrin-like molybdotransferase Glp [Aeromicrobium]MBC9224724.1 molybdopterin molybdotransferase MoeA [Aeromicrobium senzhongii]MCQ3996837.1 molybdopterin molybdenumtransferase MoeA [Aeromicrobium sp. 636]
MSRSVDEHAREVAAMISRAAHRRAQDRPVEQPVTAALSGRLAAPAVSRLDVPGFDNSQMDGFAVHAADLARAGEAPVALPTVAHVVAGDAAPPRLAPGTVAPIMTGAPLPPGANAVVPVERTRSGEFGPVDGGALVEFTEPVASGTFVRGRGTDVREGEAVLEAGTPLHPAAVGALVVAGIDTVEVAPALRLAIVATGAELVSGAVPDSNSRVLLAHAHELGLEASAHLVPDDPGELEALLDRLAPQTDLIVTTGGVSAGTREVVRQVFEPRPGAWFDHVAVQPGGPQGLAAWHHDDRVVPVVCLPGNPVSVLVSFELFLRPPLARAAGRIAQRPSGTGPLAEPLTSPPGRLQVRRGRLQPDGSVSLVGAAGSHLPVSYARAELLVLVPENVTACDAGDTVEWWRIA